MGGSEKTYFQMKGFSLLGVKFAVVFVSVVCAFSGLVAVGRRVMSGDSIGETAAVDWRHG